MWINIVQSCWHTIHSKASMNVEFLRIETIKQQNQTKTREFNPNVSKITIWDKNNVGDATVQSQQAWKSLSNVNKYSLIVLKLILPSEFASEIHWFFGRASFNIFQNGKTPKQKRNKLINASVWEVRSCENRTWSKTSENEYINDIAVCGWDIAVCLHRVDPALPSGLHKNHRVWIPTMGVLNHWCNADWPKRDSAIVDHSRWYWRQEKLQGLHWS